MSSNLKVNTILPSAGSNIGLGTNGGNLNVDGGCKVQVGTALTLGHSVGVQFATQNLHSTGFEVNNVNASGIITATSFKGNGSQLTGISGVSVTNQANNRLITATGTVDTLNANSNLTFSSGSGLLSLTGDFNVTGEVQIAENIVHIGDGNTTIGFSANDTINFKTGGSERLRIISDGKIGISRTPTQHPLEIQHASEPTVSLWRGSTKSAALQGQSGGTYLMSYEDAPLIFSVASGSGYTQRLKIDSGGRVLIGTNTEGHAAADDLTIENTSGDMGITLRSGTTGQGAIYFSDGTSGVDEYRGIVNYNHSSNFFSFYTNGSESLRMSSTGQLGVSHTLSGTSAYNRLMLHNPHDGSCWIQMTSTASGSAANTDGLSIGMNSSNVGHVWLRENAKMMFATNGTSRMEISAEGYISNSAQPMFGGYGFAGAGTQLQSNIPAFKFTTVNINQGSHFNNSTGIFTCPVAGKYLLLASFAGRADQYAWSGLYILKNGATVSDNWFPPAINTTGVFTGSHFSYAPLYSGTVYNCAANDTLVMGYHNGYSAPNNVSRNSLFIMLVG